MKCSHCQDRAKSSLAQIGVRGFAPYSVGKCACTHEGIIGGGLREPPEFDGEGIADNLKEALTRGVRVGPSPAFRASLAKYGGNKITEIACHREPVGKVVQMVINFMTGGKMSKALKELGYDDAMHLSLVLTLDTGVDLRYEKNEVCLLDVVKDPKGERVKVALKGKDITVSEFIATTLEAIGPKRMWLYDSASTNCQGFLLDNLEANKLLTPALKKFIYQDPMAILQGDPVIERVLKTVTDVGALMDVVKHGKGLYGEGVGESIGAFLRKMIDAVKAAVSGLSYGSLGDLREPDIDE